MGHSYISAEGNLQLNTNITERKMSQINNLSSLLKILEK